MKTRFIHLAGGLACAGIMLACCPAAYVLARAYALNYVGWQEFALGNVVWMLVYGVALWACHHAFKEYSIRARAAKRMKALRAKHTQRYAQRTTAYP